MATPHRTHRAGSPQPADLPSDPQISERIDREPVPGKLLEDLFGPPISVYSRVQAIADGTLVDLSEWAGECGFVMPVAVTAAVWADIEAIPRSRQGIEDVRGRAHDVLWMAAMAARRGGGGDRTAFPVILPVGRRKHQTYRLVCGPGDHAEPVITITQLHED